MRVSVVVTATMTRGVFITWVITPQTLLLQLELNLIISSLLLFGKRLGKLDLKNVVATGVVVETLTDQLANGNLPGLFFLSLEDCNLDDDAAVSGDSLARLFNELARVKSLRHLNLARNNLQYRIRYLLVTLYTIGSDLEYLNLAYNGMFHIENESLLTSFFFALQENCSRLVTLDLSGNFLGRNAPHLLGTNNINSAMTFPALQDLRLSCLGLDFHDSFAFIGDICPKKSLSLSFNRLGPYGCVKLLASLAGKPLKHLDLSGTLMGLSSDQHDHEEYWNITTTTTTTAADPGDDNDNDDRIMFSKEIKTQMSQSFLQLTQLEHLSMRKCHMDLDLMILLVEMTDKHESLQILDISDNNYNDETIRLLISSRCQILL